MKIDKKSFTIIEITLVVFIISILLLLLTPQLLNILEQFKHKQAFSQAMDLKKIILQYRFDPLKKRDKIDIGTLSDNGNDITINTLIEKGYLAKYPLTPWKTKWEILFDDLDGDNTDEVYLIAKDENKAIKLKVFICYEK